MKIRFKGWKREMTTHEHPVSPVTKNVGGSYRAGEEGKPLEWHSATRAFGKVEGLALNGAFLVEFNFEQAELRDWLLKFAAAEPEAALRLLAKVQAEAMIALASKAKEPQVATDN